MGAFPTKILLASDASKDAVKAAEMAGEIAKNSGSELHVLHVGNTRSFHVSPRSGTSLSSRSGSYDEIQDAARERLQEAVRQVEEAGGNVEQTHLKMGDPDEEILRLCEETGIGLIVMGSRGLSGVKRMVMGSVSESVVRHAHCPVLVARH